MIPLSVKRIAQIVLQYFLIVNKRISLVDGYIEKL